MDLMTRCHICNDLRPNDNIAITHRRGRLGDGTPSMTSVRYCSDRATCCEQAARQGKLPVVPKPPSK